MMSKHQRKLSQFRDSDNWDEDFSGDLCIPDNISTGNEKLEGHLELVKSFSSGSKKLEELLLSIPEQDVNRDLLDNEIIVGSLDIVAIAHEDTEVDFFKSRIGTVYKEFRVNEPLVLGHSSDDDDDDKLLSVDSHVLRRLTEKCGMLVSRLQQEIGQLNSQL